jgi:two-component system, cell cycle response regulator
MMRLREEFGRAVRINAPLGVLMFDLDYYKSVNDTYGHHIGDRILAHIAAVARSTMREGDVLVRYGGDEFVVILPAASREDVSQVAERLRRKVEETSLVDGDQTVRVTISLGGTAYPELDARDEIGFVRCADRALYSAKEAGRNRVIMA